MDAAMLDTETRERILSNALLARRFEDRVAQLCRTGELPANLHLGAGQELAQCAALAALRPDDPMLYGHRGTAYWIARGLDLETILCDMAYKEGGTNRGKGGVMHVIDPARGILGESGSLGGNFVIGAGVAYAEQRRGTGRVCIVFFGDGSASRGQFHEAANYAAVARLPLILFCENNGWAMSVPASAAMSVVDIADRAAGYGMPGVVVDGTDIDAVFSAVARAAERARSGEGPTLVEAKVPRLRGHWLGDRESYRPHGSDASALADPFDQIDPALRERLEEGFDDLIERAIAGMRERPLVSAATALESVFVP
jgi:acetoin:2,6-dichlorophenolindophenol oxidoreductase subunit alpha